MNMNPNNNKNMIDKVVFLRYLFALVPIQKRTAAFIFPAIFFFLMLNIQKNIKSPGGNTINYTEKPAVHLSCIQCCIMCANDTRIGPLLKKLLDFITFKTSE